jgi:isopenicillin-N N-acyltransferase-like protein
MVTRPNLSPLRPAIVTILAIVGLLMLTACGATVPTDGADTPPPAAADVPAQGGLKVLVDDAVPVYHLRGTPTEIGGQHGELLRDQIVGMRDFALYFAESKGGRQILDLAAEAMAPSLTVAESAEIDAIAAAAGLSRADVLLINAFLDAAGALAGREGNVFPVTGTTMAVHGSLAAGRSPLVAGSIEISLPGAPTQPDPAIFVIHPAVGKPYVTVAMPGMIGALAGHNLDGLSIVGSPVSSPMGLVKAAPTAVLTRRILARCGDTGTAAKVIVNSRIASPHNLLIGDVTGKQWALECADGRMAIRKSDVNETPGLIWATNHFLDPVMQDAQNPASVTSMTRGSKMTRFGARYPEGNGYTAAQLSQAARGASIGGKLQLIVVFDATDGEVTVAWAGDGTTPRTLGSRETFGVLRPELVSR